MLFVQEEIKDRRGLTKSDLRREMNDTVQMRPPIIGINQTALDYHIWDAEKFLLHPKLLNQTPV